jgi:hypothetical protein
MFLEGPPFVAESVADMVAMHLREPPPPPSDVWPDIPAPLEGLLLGMLEKSVDDRPSLAEIATTLRDVRANLALRTAQTRERRLASGSMPPPHGPSVVAGLATGDMSRPMPMPVVPTGSGGYAVVKDPTRRPALRWTLYAGGVALAAAAVLGATRMRASSTPSTAAPAEVATPVTTEERAVPAAPAPAPAATPTLSLEVRGAPAGSRVWIDASAATPRSGLVSGTVAPGRHTIRVEAPGYEPYRREIDVRAATVLDIELTKVARARRQRANSPATDVRVEGIPNPTAPPPPAERTIDPNGTIEPF